MRSGYFHFGNNHVFIKFSFLKDMVQMFTNGRYPHAKQLCHRFLCSPYCLVPYDYLDLAFFIWQLVQYELYFVAHKLIAFN